MFICPLCRTVLVSPFTSTNFTTRLNLLFFLKLLARDLLCRPREVFPPDPFVHLKIGPFPPPLDAARCAPPVDVKG
jgi:hypothetical protein